MKVRVLPGYELIVVLCGKELLVYHKKQLALIHLDKVKGIEEVVAGYPPKVGEEILAVIESALNEVESGETVAE